MKQSNITAFRAAINRVPIPIGGLMLGLASLGNLLSYYGAGFKIALGVISSSILLLLVLKFIFNPQTVRADLQDPVLASISCTIPMGIVILSTYLQPLWPVVAKIICGTGVILHSMLIVYYTKKFLFRFNIRKVFPSYFVVYVGIAIFSVIAPIFNAAWLGQIFFWFAFIAYLLLLPVIIYRVVVVKALPEGLVPTVTIFAAPASLCLTGYLTSFQEQNLFIIGLLTFLSVVMLSGVLLYMPKMIKPAFFPSYSAFTFPFVISATAMKALELFLTKVQLGIPAFRYLGYAEELLATGFVVYVLIRYLNFLFLTEKPSVSQA